MAITIGLLQYTLQPPQVFAGSTTDMVLVIQNPSTTQSVVFKAGFGSADQLQLQFQGLAAGTNFKSSIKSQPAGQSFITLDPASSGGYFTVKTSSGQSVLLPQQSLTVLFQAVPIDSAPGSSSIGVKQLISSGAPVSGQIDVNKLTQDPAIVAWMDPPTIGLENYSLLNFTWRGGTKVVILGFPDGDGSQTVNASGSPPFTNMVPATIDTADGQRTYTLTVYTVDGTQVAQTTCVLSHHKPFLCDASTTPAITAPISVNDQFTFSWATLYAASTTLVSSVSTSLTLVPPATGTTGPICPGADALNSAGFPPVTIPDSVVYTFTARGYGGIASQATSQFKVALQPVNVLFFKYINNSGGKLSGATLMTDPENWSGSVISYIKPNEAYQSATVYRPGQPPLTLYLGTDGTDKHPQIQYLNATAQSGGVYTLDWVTLNLTSLVINPGNVSITNLASGSQSYTPPAGTTQIVATGTSSSGDTVVSICQLPG